MSGESALPHRDAAAPAPGEPKTRLQARLDRLASLCGAARAIANSQPETIGETPESDPLVLELRALLESLSSLAEGGDAATAEDRRRAVDSLRRADHDLEALADDLGTRMESIPLSRLRATLPEIVSKRRVDALALLDVIARDHRGLVERGALFDYLITLLSTEADGAERRVTRDPTRLVPALDPDPEPPFPYDEGRAAEVVETLLEACDQDGACELGDVLARIRELKRGLGTLVLAPNVQRALVAYNTEIGNRIAERLQESGAQASQWGVAPEPSCEEVAGAAPPDAPSAPARSKVGGERRADPVLESPGLLAVARAVSEQLAGGSPGTSPEAKIARTLPLDSLDPEDRRWIESADASLGQRWMRLTVLVGLLGPLSYRSARELWQLEIGPAWLREHWPRELAAMAEALIGEALESDAPQDAKAMQSLRARYLAHVAPLAEQPGSPSALQAIRRWLARHRPEVLGLVAALLGSIAMAILVTAGRPARDEWTRQRLAEVSPHLVAIEAEAARRGRLVGTLDHAWSELPETERDAALQQIVNRLGERGARDIVLHDSVGRVRMRTSQGEAEDPDPSGHGRH